MDNSMYSLKSQAGQMPSFGGLSTTGMGMNEMSAAPVQAVQRNALAPAPNVTVPNLSAPPMQRQQGEPAGQLGPAPAQQQSGGYGMQMGSEYGGYNPGNAAGWGGGGYREHGGMPFSMPPWGGGGGWGMPQWGGSMPGYEGGGPFGEYGGGYGYGRRGRWGGGFGGMRGGYGNFRGGMMPNALAGPPKPTANPFPLD